MKLIRIHRFGEPEVMQLEDAPLPEPGAGQARIKIEAAGVNFIDIYQRIGLYKLPLPFTPGQEAAGIVDAVGTGVTDVKPGDRVAYSSIVGSYADYAVVAADRLVPVPAGVDSQLAAAAILQGMTAHYLTHDTFPLQPGHTALVHAAAGGTGQLLVQIARMRGARVIGTAGSEQKAEVARQAGADEVIIYTQHDFEAEVKRLTGDQGVDVVYDSVGKDTFDKSLNCLRKRGYMVLFGQSSGAVSPIDPLILNARGSLFLTRPTLVHYIVTREELLRRAQDVFNWIAAGKLKVAVDRVFPLAQAAAAHAALAGRQTQGKVVLIP